MADIFEQDIEQLLKDDVNGHVLKQILDELAQAKSRLQRKMDQGLSTLDFKQAESLKQSFEVCTSVAQWFWEHQHKS